jgi:hydroxymethylglutaryl-CoA lyase
MDKVFITDCPRDALQGVELFVPTEDKIRHIKTLLDSGSFDRIDFGSFVSPKAVPQMVDTSKVAEAIRDKNGAELLAVVLNSRGATEGLNHEVIDVFGYPFSISETFQKRNGNSTIEESFDRLKEITQIVLRKNKRLEVYLSMAFGNPYSDPWNTDIVLTWMEKILDLGVSSISLADTVGTATPGLVGELVTQILTIHPDLPLSVHLHSEPSRATEKVMAAYLAGCRRFDGAILGFGGCPFAQNELVGNIPSEELLRLFQRANEDQISILQESFKKLVYVH